jgi:DNA-directed RNA polymerase specialized sigma24 family protein
MITEKQWELYVERYGKLMWKIARRISGDEMTASLEDNYADLCQAALLSIEGFKKKTGQDFDTAIKNKLFDQYTKTVLWHLKAHKGQDLTDDMPFRKACLSIHGELGFNRFDDSESAFDLNDDTSKFDVSAINIKEIFKDQNEDIKAVVSTIINDPSLLRDEGGIKLSTLARESGLHINTVKKSLREIGRLMRGYQN